MGKRFKGGEMFLNDMDTRSEYKKYGRVVMHIDVNSAFLSWQAAFNLQKGDSLDLRKVPSVVGGSKEDRRGIVLAKSTPAKKFDIQTGEVLWSARAKCPGLIVVPPDYELYVKSSNALYDMAQTFSPRVQRFSVDEVFLDYTGMEDHFGDPVTAAHFFKNKIKEELGFTVNVGVSSNKLLAKMAGELKKPDMVHTLWPHEIEEKMWPLPVEELFMVGRRTAPKLKGMCIYTIGDLAKADIVRLTRKLKSFGYMLSAYARGLEDGPVHTGRYIEMKGMGNSTTMKFDVTEGEAACKMLLSLTETVCMRLRSTESCCSVMSVEFRSSDLSWYSHQRKISPPTNLTNEIFEVIKQLFYEGWKGEPLRHLGVRVSGLSCDDFIQFTIFDYSFKEKRMALDSAIDGIRGKYGKMAIMRGVFLDGVFAAMSGGSGAEDGPVMSSQL